MMMPHPPHNKEKNNQLLLLLPELLNYQSRHSFKKQDNIFRETDTLFSDALRRKLKFTDDIC